LSTGPDSWVLELGCGQGGTGRAAIAARKAGHYVGIELNPAAAEVAAAGLEDVWVGDVETMNLACLENRFDALVISEVLEHLTDPWSTLSRLAACVKPGGVVYASSPNIAHWQVIKGLIFGEFEYSASGVMDRTHLRWFTPASYRALLEGAGFEVASVTSLCRPGWKGGLLSALTGRRFDHLFARQIMIVGRRSPGSAK